MRETGSFWKMLYARSDVILKNFVLFSLELNRLNNIFPCIHYVYNKHTHFILENLLQLQILYLPGNLSVILFLYPYIDRSNIKGEVKKIKLTFLADMSANNVPQPPLKVSGLSCRWRGQHPL